MNYYDPSNSCPSCGHPRNKTEFCAKTNNCGIDHTEPLQHRVCWGCGYRWSELPNQDEKDAYFAWLRSVS